MLSLQLVLVAAATAAVFVSAQNCGWPQRAQNDQFTSASQTAGLKSVDSVAYSVSANNQVLNTPLVFNTSGQTLAVVGSSDTLLRAFDVDSGTVKWTYSTGAEVTSTCTFSAVGNKNIVICPSRVMKTFAWDAAAIASNPTAAPMWEYAGQAVFDVAAPLVCPVKGIASDKVAWMVTLDGYMHAVSVMSGQRLWRGLIDTTQTTDTGVHPVALDAACTRFVATANTVGTPTSGGHWRSSTVAFFKWAGNGTLGSNNFLTAIAPPTVAAKLSQDIGQVQPVVVAPRLSAGAASVVFFSTRSEQSINAGRLYAVNASSGAVIWMKQHSIYFSSPAYHARSKGLLVFGDTFVSTVQAELKVLFIDSATGAELNTATDPDSKWNPTQYDVGPSISDTDQVVVPSSGGKVVFLKLTPQSDGGWAMAQQFSYALSAADANNPITTPAVLLKGGSILVGTADGKIRKLSGSPEVCPPARCACGGGGASGGGGSNPISNSAPVHTVFASVLIALALLLRTAFDVLV